MCMYFRFSFQMNMNLSYDYNGKQMAVKVMTAAPSVSNSTVIYKFDQVN